MLDQRAQQYYLNAMGLPLWRLRVHKQELDVANYLIPAGMVYIDSQAAQSQLIKPEADRISHHVEDPVVEIKSQSEIASETIKSASLADDHSTIIAAESAQGMIDRPLTDAASIPTIINQSEKTQSQQPQSTPVASEALEDSLKQLQTQQWFQLLSKEISSCSLCKNRIGGKLSLKPQQLRVAQNTAKNLLLLVETPSAREYIQGQYISEEYHPLLTSIFQAMNLDANVYISSVLKCSVIKPSYLIDKEAINQEINHCSVFLKQELNNIKPDLIVTLGPLNMSAIAEGVEDYLDLEKLIQQPYKIKKYLINQQLTKSKAIPVMATFHPDFLYRNPLFKAKALQHWVNIAKTINH
jgi:uracil-DNA glycosylase family 4